MKSCLVILSLCVSLLAGCRASLPELTGPRTGQWRETCAADMSFIAQAVEKYRLKAGTFPARLDYLIVGPPDWPDLWEPLVPRTIPLDDPWGYPYRLTVFDRSRAMLTGLDLQIICAGPDHVFATDDDLAQPQPTGLYTPGLSPPGPANRPPE